MKKCTQCGQILSDETKFCFKCGGANFEPSTDTGSGTYPAQPSYQQTTVQPVAPPPVYQQPSYQQQPQQPYYPTQPTANENEPVSIGMNLLFLILANIPIVNIIYAIVVAATSKKKSYKNLAIAWFITLAIGIVLAIALWASIWSVVSQLVDTYGYNFSY